MNTHETLHADYIESAYRGDIVRVAIADVSYFKADSKYVVAYHDGGELMLNSPTTALEDAYGHRFVRAHRNTLIARDRLLSFQGEKARIREPATVRLDGVTDPIVVSRSNVAVVRAAVAQTINQHLAGEAA
ncbi:LytTR family transcriptional regulator [Pseudomonas sp. 21LCFQ02]|uniref:LytTR family DNA-binding domain-containing protein n=1 Tax=Pseudomonas sp. 21LCFQ02 TaxID=2957505 RepID=UPI00209B1867|nr:LytTR family DNA-binding domain-containing protein [Pseudomonas sp. 21LCFQ02]MCO8167840.1 LytTR family transcriptional regulator [Pseudomonas sp. 21LCFQ02]